jgi:hypothetical protein
MCNNCQHRVFFLKDVYNKHFRGCDCKVKDKQLLVLHDDKIIIRYFTLYIESSGEMFELYRPVGVVQTDTLLYYV